MRSFGIKVNRYSNLVPHSLLHCVRGALDGTGIVKAHKQSPLVGYSNLEPTFLRRSKAAPMDGPRAAPRFPLGQVVVNWLVIVFQILAGLALGQQHMPFCPAELPRDLQMALYVVVRVSLQPEPP